MKCPACGSQNVTTTVQSRTFQVAEAEANLTIDVPTNSCAVCEEQWLDEQGKEIRDRALSEYLDPPTIDWSEFCRVRSLPGSGNSYTRLSHNQVINLVRNNWYRRRAGAGESGLDRKVLVPVPAEGFFCPPRANLVVGMPVKAHVVTRQEGEDPYVETYVTPEDAEKFGAVLETPATYVDVVCYSAAALEENEGDRSSDTEFEIVAILARNEEIEPMSPLVMARNFLEKPGGTKSEYSAQEFAEAIYYWSQRGIRIKKDG